MEISHTGSFLDFDKRVLQKGNSPDGIFSKKYSCNQKTGTAYNCRLPHIRQSNSLELTLAH